MKPESMNSRPKRRKMQLTSRAIVNMVVISFFTSFLTLGAVVYGFYAIPANIEANRQGRLEERQLRIQETQAKQELVESIGELTEKVMELTNARTDVQ